MATPQAERWLNAIARPSLAASLEGVYVFIADQVEARGPACWASGRCCNFRDAGHRLYTTGLEAAYCVARLERPLSTEALDAAEARGGCAFQLANICGVHAIKPSGCRVYFCEKAAQEWQNDLTERAVEEIRRIHDREGVEYRYAEWGSLLRMFV
jgi:Fe-S-cluster containining protein